MLSTWQRPACMHTCSNIQQPLHPSRRAHPSRIGFIHAPFLASHFKLKTKLLVLNSPLHRGGRERERYEKGEREWRVMRRGRRGDSGRCDVQFKVHPRDGTHIYESPCLWNTSMTIYSWVGIQTQARQLRASMHTSRLSCHDVAIHCFVTTENIFYSF